MDDDQKVGRDVIEVLASPELRDIAKDLAESALDGISESEVVKTIPVLSTLAAAGKTLVRIRDLFLARKVVAFIVGTAEADDASRQRFFEDNCATDAQRQRLADLTLTVLDDLREADRVQLVTAFFVGLMDGNLDHDEFSELCEVATLLNGNHIRLLERICEANRVLTTDRAAQFLQYHGLALQDWSPHGEGAGPRFGPSDLGERVLRILQTTPWISR